MEERLMVDDDLYNEIQMSEAELIEDYIRGAIQADDKRRFEAAFLATAPGRRQVDLVRQIRERLGPAALTDSAKSVDRAARMPSWRRSIAAFRHRPVVVARSTVLILVLVFVLFVSWLLIKLWKLQAEVSELHARQAAEPFNRESQGDLEEMRARNNTLMQELQREQEARKILEQELASLKSTPGSKPPANSSAEPARSSLATVFLTPGIVRSPGMKETIVITAATTQVQFNLALRRTGFSTYQVLLESEKHEAIWTAKSATPKTVASGQKITLTLPARILESGEYIFRVSGVTTEGRPEFVGNYYFNLTKNN